MENNKYKTIGILGGMGPQATVDLFQNIINRTDASVDEDHLPIIIYNLPQIPNRVKAIMQNGKSPVNDLIYGAKTLKKSGADFLIIACNTAHYYADEVESKSGLKVLNMVNRTQSYLENNLNNINKIGLLATTGTIETGIYKSDKYQLITPDKKIQEENVSKSILEIKKGNLFVKRKLCVAINNLIEKGAEAIILGCTELPLVLNDNLKVPVVNPTDIIAEEAVMLAKNKLEEFDLNNTNKRKTFNFFGLELGLKLS